MSLTTHCARYDILNEFFRQPAISLEAVSNVERPGILLVSTVESIYRNKVLGYTVRSNTPETLNAP